MSLVVRNLGTGEIVGELIDVEWSFWPQDTPRPTDAEFAAAEARYAQTLNPDDMSDYNCGLRFVMATYNRRIWWPLFFPDAAPLDPMADFIQEPPHA